MKFHWLAIRGCFLTLLLTCAGCNSRSSAVGPSAANLGNKSRPATAAVSVDSSFPDTVSPRDTLPFLASDPLAGRAPGTPGLQRAGDFLAIEFARIGLKPLPGLGGYFQPFTMPLSTTLGASTNLLVNDKSLTMGTDFSPLAITGQGPFTGKILFAGYGITRDKYDDYGGTDAHGKVVLVMRREPRDASGHSRFAQAKRLWSDGAFFGTKARNAADHGAVALLVVSQPSAGGGDMVTPFIAEGDAGEASIPVLQISRRTADLLLTTGGAKNLAALQDEIDSSLSPESSDLHDVEVSGDVTIKRSTATVRNVVALLPGTGDRADEYVIVGAHYDHLGTGQLGHMMGPIGSIYHGADDNASGTAAVLELAQRMQQAGPQRRSVIFALFTAEEEGLVGSDWFVKHPPIPLEKVVAMLNMDMVGRMKDQTLLVGGWGTAANFDELLKQSVAGLPVKTQSFEKGGLGPSDHMSFALKKIPVLFLFTGLHADYHRPTDTADKINYAGIDEVVTVAQRIVDAMIAMPRQQYDGSSDSKATMAFATGHGGDERRAALGVVPDFSSVDSPHGVPITGVGAGSPADIAGLKAGDVITEFNGKTMNNLQDLSDGLSQASPGDKVVVKVLRDGKTIELHATLGARKSE